MATPVVVAAEPRTEFPAFPHNAYDIQLDFMRSLSRMLSVGGVGFFESPTGTGKTLCLITACLHWLEDARAAAAVGLTRAAGAEGPVPVPGLPDWMAGHAARRDQEQQAHLLHAQRERLEGVRREMRPRAMPRPSPGAGSADEDDEFLLDEVATGDGNIPGSTRKRGALSDSSEDEGSLGGGEVRSPDDLPKKTQVIFCSRTHSQLSQFVGELHRTKFADTLSLVALGSRSALCINPAVAGLPSAAAVNEACADLQRNKSSAPRKRAGSGERQGSRGRCPYLARGSKAAETVREMVLAHPIDIEDLAKLGRRKAVCPYYAARDALPEADIVLAPYSALLLEETREALGLRLDGNILVIDEAHNLVDAVNGAHSAAVTIAQAATAVAQLEAYLERYRSRLGPGSCMVLQQLLLVAKALQRACRPAPLAELSLDGAQRAQRADRHHVSSINSFVFDHGLEGINMFQLLRAVADTKLVAKVSGAWRSAGAGAPGSESGGPPAGLPKSAGDEQGETAAGALQAVLGLLRGLRSADADGRVIVDGTAGGSMKFIVVNAGQHFGKIVSAAKAVVLASGTLTPLGPLLPLFPSTPPERIHRFSCGHVVGKDRLLALAMGWGPGDLRLDFRYSSRNDPGMLGALGELLEDARRLTPGGIIAFFPSRQYIDVAVACWERSGLWQSMNRAVLVLQEPKNAGEVEPLLAAHAAACAAMVQQPRGAPPGSRASPAPLLLAVVGGRLAEGINFGDALGRCVVMVGLPYPSLKDPELQERMRALDAGPHASRPASPPRQSKPPSQDYYQDLCMRAVNQSVGRAIRHAGDYAAVLLLDDRYAQGFTTPLSGPLAKLPAWIQPSLEAQKSQCPKGQRYPLALRRLEGFFVAMERREESTVHQGHAAGRLTSM